MQLIEAQGGTRAALERIAVDPRRATATAPRGGVVTAIDTVAIGELARRLVATGGPFAGIRVAARVGTPVEAGEVLADVAGTGVDPAEVARAFTVGTIVRDARQAVPSNVVRP